MFSLFNSFRFLDYLNSKYDNIKSIYDDMGSDFYEPYFEHPILSQFSDDFKIAMYKTVLINTANYGIEPPKSIETFIYELSKIYPFMYDIGGEFDSKYFLRNYVSILTANEVADGKIKKLKGQNEKDFYTYVFIKNRQIIYNFCNKFLPHNRSLIESKPKLAKSQGLKYATEFEQAILSLVQINRWLWKIWLDDMRQHSVQDEISLYPNRFIDLYKDTDIGILVQELK